MKLTYWVCANLDDVPAYNLRAPTRREVNALREEYGASCYSDAYKVEVDYDSGFELLRHCFEQGASAVEVRRSPPTATPPPSNGSLSVDPTRSDS